MPPRLPMSLFRTYAASLSKKKLVLVGVMIAVLTVGLATRHYRSASLAEKEKAALAAAAASVIGSIDSLKDGGQTIAISGWAVSRDGIRDATLILNGQTRIALRTGIGRPDVAAVHAQFPNAANAGFEGTAALEPRPADAGAQCNPGLSVQ